MNYRTKVMQAEEPPVKDICRSCNKEFPKAELLYGPNPYMSDLYDEQTETVLCKECYVNACDEL